MSTVLDLSLKEIALASVDQKVILSGVGWDWYEEILAEYADSNALHFAYDNGFLEVEVPTGKHEVPSEILSKLITFACAELEIDASNFGSTTFRKKAKAKGVEPDKSFYIQNESKIRGKLEIDLQYDPPPDLVIEVDVTSPSLDKMPIYAALGVPKVWLYKGERVEFYQLIGETYQKTETSIALPILSKEEANQFLQKGLTESPLSYIRAIRQWANEKK